LGLCLGGSHRWSDALPVIEEAVATCRDLAEAEPTVFRLSLAQSLESLATCMTALGRNEEAAMAVAEARELSRQPDVLGASA
jgi:hypothetical protein